jgi:hypothetical protein
MNYVDVENKLVFLNVKQCNDVNYLTIKRNQDVFVNDLFQVKMARIHAHLVLNLMLVAS